MDLRQPILDVARGSRGRVLAALVRQVGVATGREVAVQAGVAHTTATRVLHELVASGLVHCEVQGTAHAYRFNAAHVLSPAIERLVRADVALAAIVDEVIRRWPTPPIAAWVLLGGPGTLRDVVRVVLVAPDEIDAERWLDACDRLEHRLRRATGNDIELVHETQESLAAQVVKRARLTYDLRIRGVPVGRTSARLLQP